MRSSLARRISLMPSFFWSGAVGVGVASEAMITTGTGVSDLAVYR